MAMEETSADSMEMITDTADTTIEVLDIAAAVEILLDVATFWEEVAMYSFLRRDISRCIQSLGRDGNWLGFSGP